VKSPAATFITGRSKRTLHDTEEALVGVAVFRVIDDTRGYGGGGTGVRMRPEKVKEYGPAVDAVGAATAVSVMVMAWPLITGAAGVAMLWATTVDVTVEPEQKYRTSSYRTVSPATRGTWRVRYDTAKDVVVAPLVSLHCIWITFGTLAPGFDAAGHGDHAEPLVETPRLGSALSTSEGKYAASN
jgi:hypothetical protein